MKQKGETSLSHRWLEVGGWTRSLHAFTFYLDVHYQLSPETEEWARWTSGLTQSMYFYADMFKLVFSGKRPQLNGETHHLF